MSLADAVNAPSELREETVGANLSQRVHLVGSIRAPAPERPIWLVRLLDIHAEVARDRYN